MSASIRRVTFFLISISVIFQPHAGAQERAGETATLDESLKFQLDVRRQEYQKPIKELNSLYESQLKGLESEVRKAGDLDNLLLVQRELKALSDPKGTGTKQADVTPFPRLKKLRDIYDTELAKRELAESKQLVQLFEGYIRALDIREKQLTQAGKVEEAIGTRKETVRAKELLAESLAFLDKETAKASLKKKLDWEPGSPEDLEELLKAHTWNWTEKNNNQVVHFLEDEQLRIDGKGGKFGWEVSGSRDVILRLGANQRQRLLFRLSRSEKELLPTEGQSKARNITMKPAD